MDIEQYVRFVLALVAVLVLIVLALWLLKRVGMAGVAAGGRGRGRRRLSVVEAVALDTRRRLVLVRRDGVEHLLLLGGTGDLVVESGIRDSFAASMVTADGPAAADAAPLAMAPPVATIIGQEPAGPEPAP